MAKFTLFVRNVLPDKAGHKYLVVTDTENRQGHIAYERRDVEGSLIEEDLKGKVIVASCTTHALPPRPGEKEGSVKLVFSNLEVTNQKYEVAKS